MVKESFSTQAPHSQTWKSDELEAVLHITCILAPALIVWTRKPKLEEGLRFPVASVLLKGLQGVERKSRFFSPSLPLTSRCV